MSEIAGPRIELAIMNITQVATGDHPERTHGA
jgi:hypothetical protein